MSNFIINTNGMRATPFFRRIDLSLFDGINVKKCKNRDQFDENKCTQILICDDDFLVEDEVLSYENKGTTLEELVDKKYARELPVEVKEHHIATAIFETLAIVDIVNPTIKVTPKFHPHSREFYEVRELLDCYHDEQVIESWKFPVMGAEKLTKNKLKSLGVSCPAGVISVSTVANVIDAAREKLDGYEVVTFGIKVHASWKFFEWGPTYIKEVHDMTESLCELIGNDKYLLYGQKNNTIDHKWEYLTTALLNDVKEGIIVRINGKEYRVPRILTATFEVKENKVVDNREVEIKTTLNCKVPLGFYDFNYIDGNWEIGKRRPDKIRADSNNGAQFTIADAVTIDMLRNSILIPHMARQLISKPIVVVTYPAMISLQSRVETFRRFPDNHVIWINSVSNMSHLVKKMKVLNGNIFLDIEDFLIISGTQIEIPRSHFFPFYDPKRKKYYTPVPLNYLMSRIVYCYVDGYEEQYVKCANVKALRCYATEKKFYNTKLDVYKRRDVAVVIRESTTELQML
jgi:hypothetical protein